MGKEDSCFDVAFSLALPLLNTTNGRSLCLTLSRGVAVGHRRLRSTTMMNSMGNVASVRLKREVDANKTATQELISWCISHGVKMPKLQISQSEHGRSLSATTEIGPSEALISVPSALLLKVEADPNAKPPALAHILLRKDSHFWERAPWEMRLAVVLLNELRGGTSSAWRPYIRALPERPSSALVALADRTRCARARTQLAALGLIEEADTYAAHVLQQHASLCDALETGVEAVEFHDFCWAVSIAQSRAFGVPPETVGAAPVAFALFPALDCGNHSARVRCELRFDARADAYVAMAGFGASLGQEVYLNYGDKNAEQLALFYGFVEGGSPGTSVTVGPEAVWDAQDDEEPEQIRRRKQEVLDKLGLAGAALDFRLTLHEVDAGLMMALRVAFASEEELCKIEEMASGDKRFRVVALANEVKVWACVEQRCERLLGDVGALQEDFERRMKLDTPFSVSCSWGEDENKEAEALIRFERNRVLLATMERVRHFSNVSTKIGMVCTVLVPPSQSLVKADLFDFDIGGGGSGVHSFTVDDV